jgi:hypothetical protein
MKKIALFSLLFSIIFLGGWELYWRSQGYFPNLDDDKHLWAKTRAKVEKANPNDVVIIGSSRVLFDIQLPVWQKLTGVKPIQLANAGATPLPVFNDIVEKTDFKGTVIVGVTEGLLFSTTFPLAEPWARSANRVAFYHKRTYAQRLNYLLWVPLQRTFAFIAKDEESWADDINLKALLKRIQLPPRTDAPKMPPFYRFQEIDGNRNVRMREKMDTDTTMANSVKTVWGFLFANIPPPDKESTMAYFLKDAEKFTARGGKIILVRCPSDGMIKEMEAKGLPRSVFWDDLVAKTNAPAYHYEDFEGLTGLKLPEWSHLSASDADLFTERLVEILLKDKVIPNFKTN